MAKIVDIIARQVLDSRGNPTIEGDVYLDDGYMGRAQVPSGASTGSREALELRDGDQRLFLGKSVYRAVEICNGTLKEKLVGHEIEDLAGIDQLMLDLDGTDFKSNLGANSLLAVSMACARAGAHSQKISLFKYLRDLKAPCVGDHFVLPSPLMNIVNGGEHASNNLDIQEFMIVPHLKTSFKENLRAGVEVFHHLKKVLSEKGHPTNVGDEGGFAPNLNSHDEALDLILVAIEKAGYRPGEEISFSLDAAASEFHKEGQYHLGGEVLGTSDMISYYSKLTAKYPLYSIEDGLAEADFEGWSAMTRELGDKVVLVGDDLFVTNQKILQEGIDKKQANAILVKLNQIGTVSETFATMRLAYDHHFKCVVSHRSGETSDPFIADLAVATNSGHIKTGSASRSDRMEKYNQLLRIEEELGEQAVYIPVK